EEGSCQLCLVDQRKAVKLGCGGNIVSHGRVRRGQEPVFTSFKVLAHFNQVNTGSDLLWRVIKDIAKRSAGVLDDSTIRGAELSAVGIGMQVNELIFTRRAPLRNVKDELHGKLQKQWTAVTADHARHFTLEHT